jgi:subtilisin family serine protease
MTLTAAPPEVPEVEVRRAETVDERRLAARIAATVFGTPYVEPPLPDSGTVVYLAYVDGQPAAFSTRGAHVALTAPGLDIFTAGVSGYQYATGTSFAAPFVAAAAALLVARAERRSYPIDGSAVRSLLQCSTTPLRGNGSGCGTGVLNALAALRALDAEIDRIRPDDDDN